VADSGVRRRLAASAYNRRVEESARAFATLSAQQPGASCLAEIEDETLARYARSLDDVARARAEHVIREVARTREARAALEAGSISRLGALMSRTHESLRDSYEVSCVELDSLVETALRVDGVHGGRLVGAGFGGCAAFLLERGASEAFEERLTSEHRARFGSAPGVWFLRDAGAPREL
jgi:galactokinase